MSETLPEDGKHSEMEGHSRVFFFLIMNIEKSFCHMCVCGERNSNSRTILIMNENTYLVYFTLYYTVPERRPVAAQGIFGKAATQRMLRVEDTFFFFFKQSILKWHF